MVLFIMKRLVLSALLSLCFVFARAQENYFYGTIKIPLIDYIQVGLLKDNSNVEKMEGALFEIGYAINTDDYFLLELGLEAFFYSPFNKRYYIGNSKSYDEFSAVNKALSFQARPILRFDLGEDSYFRIAAALNLRKQNSSATFYQNSHTASSGIYKALSKSSLTLSIQPLVGVEAWFNKNFGMGLDLAYIYVNWNKSMQHLKFNTMYPISVPKHQTSNVFLTGRIFFR